MSNGGQFKYEGGTQTPTVPVIKAQGEARLNIGILWFAGVSCTLLVVAGILVFFIKPDSGKDLWLIIGPILSTSIVTAIGCLRRNEKVDPR